MKIFLFVLLILFLIFVMIMISSVHIYVFFQNELKFRVRFWFYIYKSENTKSKDKKKKLSDKDEKKKKHKKEKVSEKKILSKNIAYMKCLYNIGSTLLVRFFRLIKIKCLFLYIAVGSDDAATTAINYGRLCSILYPLISVTLKNNFQSRPDIQIKPDFQLQKSKMFFKTNVRVNVGKTFWLACIALVSYLKLMYKFKQKKEFDKNGRK